MSKAFILAPSILSADFLHLGEELHEAEQGGADWIHIDIMDGHFVPNISLGPGIVRACRQATQLPLDVHLMVTEPGDILVPLKEAGADRVTVHIEVLNHADRTLHQIRDMDLKAGIALNPSTHPNTIEWVRHLADTILVMTVNPGFSGQSFIESTIRKVEEFRQWKENGLTEAIIQVDGGINDQTARRTASVGAEAFAAASYVFKHPEGIQAALTSLRSAIENAVGAE